MADERTRLKILIAEDNRVNQLLMSAIFDGTGHELTFADNGAAAVEAFGEDRFDLVLMDIRMPVMDGFEASREIRRREMPGEHCLIIAVTAQGMPANDPEIAAAGIDAMVAKPIDRPTLFSKIHEEFNPALDLGFKPPDC